MINDYNANKKYRLYISDNKNGFYNLRITTNKKNRQNDLLWFDLPSKSNNQIMDAIKKYSSKSNNDIFTIKIADLIKSFNYLPIKQVHYKIDKHGEKYGLNILSDFVKYYRMTNYDFLQSRIVMDTINNNDERMGEIQKLMREYHRAIMVQEVMTYERHHYYIILLEKILISGINKTLAKTNFQTLKSDPIISALFDYDLIKDTFIKFGSKLTTHELDQLVAKIKQTFENFNSIEKFPIVPYGYDESTDEFYCGQIRKQLNFDVKKALFWKLEKADILDKNIQIFLILMPMLRYMGICDLYQQWSMPEKFYSDLVNKGYNCEGFASPFNSQMLVLDYKNGTNDTVFCSLFPDVDAPFGCIGNFFSVDLTNKKTVMVPPIIDEITLMLSKYISDHPNQNMMLVNINKPHSFGPEKIIISTADYYFENKTLTNQVVNFNYGHTLNINLYNNCDLTKSYMSMSAQKNNPNNQNNQNNLDNLDNQNNLDNLNNLDNNYPNRINISLLHENIEDLKIRKKYVAKLATEWCRYLSVQKIKLLGPQTGKLNYEWNNILERFLLSMANLPTDNNDNRDAVFRKIPLDHELYRVLDREMSAKKIFDENIKEKINAIKEKINNIIDEYFISLPDRLSILPVAYGYNGVSYYCGANYVRTIDRNRDLKLIKKLSLSGKVKYFNIIILICFLRYECVLSLGQHWNFPFVWYEYLYNKINVRLEGFSSPFNSQLLMAEKNIPNGTVHFGSLFYDTDKYFGSVGNIFDLDIQKITHNDEINISINPPFIESIMTKMVDLLNKWFGYGIKLTIIIGVPPWHDAEYMILLKNHKHLVYTNELFHNQFYYENSNDPEVPRIKLKSSVVIFILSNNPDRNIDFGVISKKFGEIKYVDGSP